MGAYYNQGISDTPRILAKGTLVHHHNQQGAVICITGGSGQAEGEGGCPPSTANRAHIVSPVLWFQSTGEAGG